MQIIVSTLLALLVIAQGWTVVLAQPSPAPARPGVAREAPAPAPSSESPAASPRTVERIRILGMSAPTAIFVAAALLFVIVLAAAFLSVDDPGDRRTGIDPRL